MKAPPLHRALIAVVAVFLMCAAGVAHAQDVVIRMGAAPASTSGGRVSELTRTPDLLIVVSPELLASEDLAPLQRFTAAVLQGLHSKIPIRICLIRAGVPEIAGPFRSAQEIRSVLRALPSDPATPAPPDGSALLAGIAAALESIPSAWGYTLIAGNLPAFTAGADPDVTRYAAAWLTRQFVSQKRSLLFWQPNGIPVIEGAQMVSRYTGGFVFQQSAELVENLLSGENLVGFSAGLPPPQRGFRLGSVGGEIPELAGETAPVIVASASFAVPPISAVCRITGVDWTYPVGSFETGCRRR